MSSPNKVLSSSRSAAHLGYQIAFSMLIFIGLGIFGDRFFDSSPWLTLAGAAFGLVSIFALIYKEVKMVQMRQKRFENEMKASGKSYSEFKEEWPEDEWDKKAREWEGEEEDGEVSS